MKQRPIGNITSWNDLWYFATELALTTAHPTASAGNYAIVGSTDTVWIWDDDTNDWVNSGVSSMWDMTKSVYDPNYVEKDVFDSANHTYDNTTSWLSATKTKTAIDELTETKQEKAEVISTNKTADIDGVYVVVANSTFTDPASPTEWKWYKVIVRNGTATVGWTWYSTAWMEILRIYHSWGYANYIKYPSSYYSTVATSWSYNDLSNKPSIPDNTDYVDLTNAQTVAWIKTFSSIPVWPTSDPTTDNQLVRKKYVDDWLAPKLYDVDWTIKKIEVVSALPWTPASDTLYFIEE